MYMNKTENTNYELIRTVMLGHAVGDALGVPVEFWDRSVLDGDPVTAMRGNGTYPYPAGMWSDDTSMSLCALEAMSCPEFSYEHIMDNFMDWLWDNRFTATGESFDVGGTCLQAIRNYCLDKVLPHESGLRDEYSNGNGSLMRIHPFVLYAYVKGMDFDGENGWGEWISRGSALTHAHDRSKLGCLIYAFVLMGILSNPAKDGVRAGIRRAGERLSAYPEFEEYQRIFAPDFEALTRDEIRSSGYVVDTLEAALWCLLTTDSYRACVLKAVNLGGDTDTVGAVAGGLAAALYGADAIPTEWLDTLQGIGEITALCRGAAERWSS